MIVCAGCVRVVQSVYERRQRSAHHRGFIPCVCASVLGRHSIPHPPPPPQTASARHLPDGISSRRQHLGRGPARRGARGVRTGGSRGRQVRARARLLRRPLRTGVRRGVLRPGDAPGPLLPRRALRVRRAGEARDAAHAPVSLRHAPRLQGIFYATLKHDDDTVDVSYQTMRRTMILEPLATHQDSPKVSLFHTQDGAAALQVPQHPSGPDDAATAAAVGAAGAPPALALWNLKVRVLFVECGEFHFITLRLYIASSRHSSLRSHVSIKGLMRQAWEIGRWRGMGCGEHASGKTAGSGGAASPTSPPS